MPNPDSPFLIRFPLLVKDGLQLILCLMELIVRQHAVEIQRLEHVQHILLAVPERDLPLDRLRVRRPVDLARHGLVVDLHDMHGAQQPARGLWIGVLCGGKHVLARLAGGLVHAFGAGRALEMQRPVLHAALVGPENGDGERHGDRLALGRRRGTLCENRCRG
jgi:hypothetical protein